VTFSFALDFLEDHGSQAARKYDLMDNESN
jgi:hypothetical protein